MFTVSWITDCLSDRPIFVAGSFRPDVVVCNTGVLQGSGGMYLRWMGVRVQGDDRYHCGVVLQESSAPRPRNW